MEGDVPVKDNASMRDDALADSVSVTDGVPVVRRAKKKKLRSKKWNLVILGVSSVVIAICTTGISLAIYHSSGDIYLDRSRPGYLPDEGEIEEGEERESEYVFEKTGKINREVLDEYLENLNEEVEAIDAYEKPFGQGTLSDERLGIPADEAVDEGE